MRPADKRLNASTAYFVIEQAARRRAELLPIVA
jgi:hypothetical protein